jgi:hypothetical protein
MNGTRCYHDNMPFIRHDGTTVFQIGDFRNSIFYCEQTDYMKEMTGTTHYFT